MKDMMEQIRSVDISSQVGMLTLISKYVSNSTLGELLKTPNPFGKDLNLNSSWKYAIFWMETSQNSMGLDHYPTIYPSNFNPNFFLNWSPLITQDESTFD